MDRSVNQGVGTDSRPSSHPRGFFHGPQNYNLLAPVCSCADPSRDLDCDKVRGFAPTPITLTPAPTEPAPTPAPVPEPTPEPPTPETAQPTSAVGENAWVPKVGDAWQYNLNTPVNTDVDADVFFIDMGEREQETPRGLRGVGRGLNFYCKPVLAIDVRVCAYDETRPTRWIENLGRPA